MYDVILSFITAFSLTYLAIPNIIKVATDKHLYDQPDDTRRSHETPIPRLGGIAICWRSIVGNIMDTFSGICRLTVYTLCTGHHIFYRY